MNATSVPSRPCPICSAVVTTVIHHQRFALPPGHPLPTSFDVVACDKCDFVYADTRAAEADYDRYYGEYSKYSDQTTATGGGGNFEDKVRIEATAKNIAEHLTDLATFVVDVGCANGGLLAELRKLGYTNLLGIDPSSQCVENTRSLFGIPAAQGWLRDVPHEAVPAGLVILAHVMEHILDLKDAVSRLRNMLAPGGMVYVEVPDASRYLDYLAAPFQDFNTEHINHFCPESLGNLFLQNGFEQVLSSRKTFPLPGGKHYPACYAIFRRSDAVPSACPLDRAPAAIVAIKAYVAASSDLLDRINDRLSSTLQSPVIVWGVGQLALKLLVETLLANAEIVAFTDGNPLHHGGELRGVPVISPQALRDLPSHPIIIASLLHQEAIAHRIVKELQLTNPIITLV